MVGNSKLAILMMETKAGRVLVYDLQELCRVRAHEAAHGNESGSTVNWARDAESGRSEAKRAWQDHGAGDWGFKEGGWDLEVAELNPASMVATLGGRKPHARFGVDSDRGAYCLARSVRMGILVFATNIEPV
jgi:hypothetical protein